MPAQQGFQQGAQGMDARSAGLAFNPQREGRQALAQLALCVGAIVAGAVEC